MLQISQAQVEEWQNSMRYIAEFNYEKVWLDWIHSRICQAGSESVHHWPDTWQGGYLIQQNPLELAALLRILKLCSYSQGLMFEHTLDIGIAAGGTTRIIREYAPCLTTTVVDDGKHRTFAAWAENKKDIENLTEIIGDSQSQEIIDRVRALNYKFDLVMIDADHSYEGVKADYENYREMFADGAIVWFHDTVGCSPTVGRLWEEIKSEGHRVLLDTGTYLGIGAIAYRR